MTHSKSLNGGGGSRSPSPNLYAVTPNEDGWPTIRLALTSEEYESKDDYEGFLYEYEEAKRMVIKFFTDRIVFWSNMNEDDFIIFCDMDGAVEK